MSMSDDNNMRVFNGFPVNTSEAAVNACSLFTPNKCKVYTAYRIELHRDREMTFLGVFSTELLARRECFRHLRVFSERKEIEYHIQECWMNVPEDASRYEVERGTELDECLEALVFSQSDEESG